MRKAKLIVLLVLSFCMLFLFSACTRSNPLESSKQFKETPKPTIEKKVNLAKMNAEQIAEHFKDNSLPISKVIVYNEDTDANGLLGKPNQYISKANFADSRINQPDVENNPIGGSIEVFSSKEDATSRKEYIQSYGEEVYHQYLYLYENILLRLDKELTQTQINEYLEVFRKATG